MSRYFEHGIENTLIVNSPCPQLPLDHGPTLTCVGV